MEHRHVVRRIYRRHAQMFRHQAHRSPPAYYSPLRSVGEAEPDLLFQTQEFSNEYRHSPSESYFRNSPRHQDVLQSLEPRVETEACSAFEQRRPDARTTLLSRNSKVSEQASAHPPLPR